jgi:hypothetical protein
MLFRSTALTLFSPPATADYIQRNLDVYTKCVLFIHPALEGVELTFPSNPAPT